VPAVPPRQPTTREQAISDFISPAVIDQKTIDAYVAAALAADPVRTDWKALDQYNQLDPAKVTVPALLIQGERDPLALTDAQARLFTKLANPDRQWVVLAGGDHAALLEDTAPAFIASIVNFVERPKLPKR
jgi:pimeloyl-ACP methyl ester carboxylesterase